MQKERAGQTLQATAHENFASDCEPQLAIRPSVAHEPTAGRPARCLSRDHRLAAWLEGLAEAVH